MELLAHFLIIHYTLRGADAYQNCRQQIILPLFSRTVFLNQTECFNINYFEQTKLRIIAISYASISVLGPGLVPKNSACFIIASAAGSGEATASLMESLSLSLR
jgi:hypothetical protein